MRKAKVCILGFLVALTACEAAYAGTFSFGSKKKKEEPKQVQQQVVREAQKPAAKKIELTERERKDLNKGIQQTGGGGGGGTGSILTGNYKLDLPVNPNSDVTKNPNAGFSRNPNLDIPRASSGVVSAPKNPNAGAVPRNPNARE